MNKITNSIVLGSALAAATLISGPTLAAGLSGNVGVMSDYFYRGIDQGTSATASAGVDYDFGTGLAVGVWGADVGDGLEVDLYGSYSGELNNFSYSVGFTSYQYTGEFDETYNEVNLGLGTGPVSLEYSIGSYDSSPSQDYTFLALTFEQGGAYAKYGTFGNDFDGSYIELGYGMEAGGFDLGVAIISADDDLSVVDQDGDTVTDAEVSMVFSLGKSFDL